MIEEKPIKFSQHEEIRGKGYYLRCELDLTFESEAELNRLMHFVETNLKHLDTIRDAVNMVTVKTQSEDRSSNYAVMEIHENLEDNSYILIVHPKADKYRGGIFVERMSNPFPEQRKMIAEVLLEG